MQCPHCGAELAFEDSKCPECSGVFSDIAYDERPSKTGLKATVGTRVLAKWTDGFWYNAIIDDTRGKLRHVVFSDGYKMWADRREYSCAQDQPFHTDRDDIDIGLCQQVQVLCPDEKWYPAMIDALFGRIWHVTFHDGLGAWVSEDQIKSDEEGHEKPKFHKHRKGQPRRGSRILAQYTNGLWYPGVIEDEQDELRRVLFFLGKELWLEPHQISTVSEPSVSQDSQGIQLSLGQRVLGLWHDGRWYPGVADAQFGKLWHISFDDLDQAWVDSSRIIIDGVSPSENEILHDMSQKTEAELQAIDTNRVIDDALQDARKWKRTSLWLGILASLFLLGFLIELIQR